MMAWIDTLAGAAHRAGFAWQARREVARLRRAGGEAALTLAGAIEAALGDEADAAAAAWMRRIEALRAALQASDAEVSFCDYGAGTRRLAPGGAAPFREVTRRVRAVCRSSAPPHEARVLFHLVRRFAPALCLELGTCLGISAAYQAAALALNGRGRLVTLEGGAALARLAERHLEGLGLRNVEVVTGRFAETLPGVLAAHGPFGYAFIDGHHDPAALRAYVHGLTPHLADEAVLVFDDLFWTTGMRRAWRAVAADAGIGTTADLLAFGVCLYRRAA